MDSKSSVNMSASQPHSQDAADSTVKRMPSIFRRMKPLLRNTRRQSEETSLTNVEATELTLGTNTEQAQSSTVSNPPTSTNFQDSLRSVRDALRLSLESHLDTVRTYRTELASLFETWKMYQNEVERFSHLLINISTPFPLANNDHPEPTQEPLPTKIHDAMDVSVSDDSKIVSTASANLPPETPVNYLSNERAADQEQPNNLKAQATLSPDYQSSEESKASQQEQVSNLMNDRVSEATILSDSTIDDKSSPLKKDQHNPKASSIVTALEDQIKMLEEMQNLSSVQSMITKDRDE